MNILEPQLSDALEAAELKEAAENAWREEDDVRGCRFAAGTSRGLRLQAPLEIRGCLFESWRFEECAVPRLQFTDVLFRSCDLSGLDLTGCSLLRCRFSGCKAVGAYLAEAKLRQVLFEDCQMQLANLSDCRCQTVRFSRCDFTGAALLGLSLTKTAFDNCRLVDVQLTGTPLGGLDLTSCTIEGWSLRGEELRGAIVTPFQAAELSRLLGLVIREG